MDVHKMLKSLYWALPLKRQLFGLLRNGPRLPSGLYQHLHFEGPFEVRLDPDHQFTIQSFASYVENELFWAGYGGSWESTSLRVWAALCRSSNGLALDIGANTGVYALAAAALGRDVVAFEPVERMARRLRSNVDLNGFPIRIEQKAVSDRSGLLPIYDDLTEHNYSASLEGQGPGADSYVVEVCALDDYLAALGKPIVGAVKIDVERHEPAVFRGMTDTLASQSPPILVEVLDREIGGQIGQLVEGLGYRIFHIDEQHGLVPDDELRPLDGTDWNHLLCTGEDFERAGLGQFLAKVAVRA